MDFEGLDRRLMEAVDSGDFAGTVLITRSGADVFSFAGGLADRAHGTPVTDRTRFGTASVTKMFTSTAIMRVVERGNIELDSKLVDLVPEEMRPASADPRITIDHLLSHRSGIADYFDEETLGAEAYALVWEEIPVSKMRTPRDFVPLMRDLTPLREPGGSVAHYCNAGFVLAAIALEEVLDKRFVEIVEEEVLAVAGMTDSGFLAADATNKDMATGYMRKEGPDVWTTNIFSIPAVPGADGGCFCTARDLDRFLHALTGGLLVSHETLTTMITPRGHFEDGWGSGLGMLVNDSGRGYSFGKDGEDPGFSARAFHYPELETNVVLLANEIEATTPFFKEIRRGLEGG